MATPTQRWRQVAQALTNNPDLPNAIALEMAQACSGLPAASTSDEATRGALDVVFRWARKRVSERRAKSGRLAADAAAQQSTNADIQQVQDP